jgi:hypothetical protein
MALRASYDDLSNRMTATAATELTARRQPGGNSNGVSLSRASTANLAPCLTPVAESVAENKVHGLVTDKIGLPEPYRYGDSNPGFRTENPAS